jgi:hypothetical protein
MENLKIDLFAIQKPEKGRPFKYWTSTVILCSLHYAIHDKPTLPFSADQLTVPYMYSTVMDTLSRRLHHLTRQNYSKRYLVAIYSMSF